MNVLRALFWLLRIAALSQNNGSGKKNRRHKGEHELLFCVLQWIPAHFPALPILNALTANPKPAFRIQEPSNLPAISQLFKSQEEDSAPGAPGLAASSIPVGIRGFPPVLPCGFDVWLACQT
jgi:hypothetical protein